MHETGHRSERSSWGTGEEVTIYRTVAGRESEYHLFFDDRGVLVGYIGVLYEGLALATQPTYTRWLAKQTPTDFVLSSRLAERLGGRRSGRLYADKGERIIGQAIVIPSDGRQILYVDSAVLSAYAPLLSPYKREYLSRIHLQAKETPSTFYGPYESEGRDYIARQHFAKGEVAHFALCGQPETDRAIEGYRQAIDIGLSEPRYQSEAYHRLGLAYRDKERYAEAVSAMETSLKIRPDIPEVVNHLGKVYALMGDTTKAVEAFHAAIGLRPNYALAHFYLAESIEATDPRRALTAYENYLAYVEATPAEKERIAKAKARVQALKARQ